MPEAAKFKMMDNPDRLVAEIRAVAAEKRLLRAQDEFEKRAAETAHQEALAQLERIKRSAERG
jgi:hypothetical protein